MKFNRSYAIGFLLGFFILGRTLNDIINGNNYGIMDASVGIIIAIFFGFVFGGISEKWWR